MKPENGKVRLPDKAFKNISDSSYQDDDLKKIQGRYSPVSIFVITIIGIAVAEIIAMVVVYYQRHLPYYQQVFIDTVVMTVIIFPLLYFMSFRTLIQHIKQRYRVEQMLQSRLRIMQYSDTHTLDEMLQFALDELEVLTGSLAGYFHFIEADQKGIQLQTWSSNTLENMCQVNGLEKHYSVDNAGVWADCIRQRKAVVHNDYASLPASQRKGLPDGHAPILREMAVPIMRDGKIVAVLGLGNKSANYTESDVDLVSTLAEFLWDIVRQKLAGVALRKSEEKFRTLVEWTYDWEKWLDPQGQIIYISPSCERITGYSPEEFITNPELLTRIVHAEDRNAYEDHHRVVHDETAGPITVEYRILARDGSEHWIEHVCRPLFDTEHNYLGRRISNRDITQRKFSEWELEKRNQKEKVLTKTIHTMQLDIARDLHDSLGQNISFLRMKLEFLAGSRSVRKADMQAELQTMTKAANESYDLIRGTLAVLQSTESSDMFRIFSRYAEQIEERSSIRVEFSSDGNPRSMSPKRMRQLFFIFREALTNIEKHAQASRVSIAIGWNEDCVNLIVSDDGQGFDPLHPNFDAHYGLKFMRERVELLNGSLNIESAENAGTKLLINVPYE